MVECNRFVYCAMQSQFKNLELYKTDSSDIRLLWIPKDDTKKDWITCLYLENKTDRLDRKRTCIFYHGRGNDMAKDSV